MNVWALLVTWVSLERKWKNMWSFTKTAFENWSFGFNACVLD